MSFRCRYVALYVPDLEEAEVFYRGAFDMSVLFRESEREDAWYTLRNDLAWSDFRSRGVRVDMIALEREDLVLALFRGDPRPGAVFELSVGVEPTEIDAIRARLSEEATVEEHREGWLRFIDPFGFRWAVADVTRPFTSSGEMAGRWLG